MKKLLLIALLIVGCSIEPVTDIMVAINPESYECSIYGYANISSNINQILEFEDSLSVLVEVGFGDKKKHNVNQAINTCENAYNDGYVYYSADSLIGIFDSCNCLE
tara:strand:- start:2743 stop:3060 length:318 start_codon:yes stop_codon:yes gene_type:complete